MMIQTLRTAARDRARLAEMLRITSRLGLDIVLARLGIGQAAEGSALDSQDLPRRVRQAMEELGPTFVKLGQILATRSDLLPPEWIAELSRLHSEAPTLPFDDLRAQVEAALGDRPEAVFATFDPAPLAAASIAQVHRATLPDGRAVVLKIRRPGIRPRVEADLRLISQLAAVAETSSAEARRFAPSQMIGQLAEAMLGELDFTTEARNADRLRADFADEARVIVPAVHWAWTSETLLVMDYVEGVPPRDRASLQRAGIDPHAIAALGAASVLDMVLINGRFHADPHPGNLLCLPGDRIALLDLGMIGHVSPRRREELLTFVQSLTSGDPTALADTLVIWSQASAVPREQLLVAAEQLIARHGGERIVLSAVIGDFMALIRDRGLALPPDLLLIFKALVTIDGVLSAIEPDFDLADAMRGAATRIALSRMSLRRWEPLLRDLLIELNRIGDDAPRLLRAAVRRLEAPAAAQVAPVAREARGAGGVIAAAILLGAVIVAAAILFTAH